MSEKYETVLVYNPDLEDAALEAEISKVRELVESSKGSIDKKDIWGKRELSYEIQNRTYGHYVLLEFTGEASLVGDLERQLKLSEPVLRHLVVKKDRFAPDGRPTDNEETEGADAKTPGDAGVAKAAAKPGEASSTPATGASASS